MTSHRTTTSEGEGSARALLETAAGWLIAHDGEMTAAQRLEFERWLASNSRHAQAWTEAQQAWARLDRLPELTPLATAARKPAARRVGWVMVGAAAAAVVLGFFAWPRDRALPVGAKPELVHVVPTQLVLSDGTKVELNAGSDVQERFTPQERRVALLRGEAHFTVVKNPDRPFIVEADGVAVRAVGTAFNVRLERRAIEVLVTEGRVSVVAPAKPAIAATPEEAGSAPTLSEQPSAIETPVLTAGQRAVVAIEAEASAPRISTVSSDEMNQALAWQALHLKFRDMPLEKVAAEFNRHNRVQLVVDPAAADTPVAGNFRAESVELFVRLLVEAFDIAAETRGNTIVLRKAR